MGYEKLVSTQLEIFAWKKSSIFGVIVPNGVDRLSTAPSEIRPKRPAAPVVDSQPRFFSPADIFPSPGDAEQDARVGVGSHAAKNGEEARLR